MDKSNGFNANIYRAILSQNDPKNTYEAAETQRKSLAQMFETACESMDNASTCEILSHRLDEYTKTVYKDGDNIYNTLLSQTFPNVASERQLKIPQSLPKLNLNLYLKDLGCSSSEKIFCNQSEQLSQAELQQFGNLFNTKNEQTVKELPNKTKISLESRFDNLDKLQNPKQYCVQKADFPTNVAKKQKNSGREQSLSPFVTARDELENPTYNKFGTGGGAIYTEESGVQKKKLGMRRTARSKFVSPLLSRNESSEETEQKVNPVVDDRLKNIEPKMVELIMGEIMDQGPSTGWDDIAGLEFAKSAIQEAVVWPMLRPDIFTGLRRPPKGILLFGPPGTGKTLIGKCVASQSKSTFFSISASSLTSKWIGDGEKMVRALFAVARVHQPAVIFIDEVDSLLTQRSDTEHESSRRIKTEFLVQLDGATTDGEERILVIGATNRPQELDEAARRRFVKRLYIPLPELKARHELINKLMTNERHFLTEEDVNEIARLSEGYSGADIRNLCSEASLGPIRSIDFSNIEKIQASEVRPLTMEDFEQSFKRVRPSVSQNDLIHYVQWDKTYGSGSSL